MSSSDKTKHDEAARLWNEFTRVQMELHAGELPLKPSFYDVAGVKFDPVSVAQILIDERHSYFAHKEILFAAYISWVLTPSDSVLWQDAIILTALTEMARAEELALRDRHKVGLMADFVVRYQQMGPVFLDQIYYPLGGVAAFSRAPSRSHYQASIAENAPAVQSIVELVGIYHYCINTLVPIGRRKPSQIAATNILFEVADFEGRGLLKGRSVIDHWSRWKSKVALLYAASATRASNTETLLDHLLNGTASYAEHHSLITEWLSKARFAAEKILSGIYNPQESLDSLAVLPPNASLAIVTPTYSDDSVKKMGATFRPVPV